MRCDQTRPSCTKCSGTGRKCDGYPPESERTTAPFNSCDSRAHLRPVEIARSVQDASGLTPAGARSFAFFRIETSIELAGPLRDSFWTQLVLQVSHREECVRQVVLALSSLHQSFTRPHQADLANEAGRHYTQGLRLLNRHINLNKKSKLEVTLLCTILCVTFEWLRGNLRGAEVHLTAGIELLGQWYQTAKSHSNSTWTSFSSPGGHLIRFTLAPAYTRIYLQAQSLLPQQGLALPPPEERSTHSLDRPFENFHEARESLYEIICAAYSFNRLSQEEQRKKGQKRRGTYRRQRRRPAQELEQWSNRLDGMFSRHPHLESELGALVLKIWLEVTTIMIGVKDSSEETACEEYTPGFATIVDLTEELHRRGCSFFCAELSIVAILYFVGLKCRQPSIRRRAIALLSATPRREGIWDSIEAANVSRQILETEERQANEGAGVELGRQDEMRGVVATVDVDTRVWKVHSCGQPDTKYRTLDVERSLDRRVSPLRSNCAVPPTMYGALGPSSGEVGLVTGD